MSDWQQTESGDWLDRDLRQMAEGLRFPPTPDFRMPRTTSGTAVESRSPLRYDRWRGGQLAVTGLMACLVLALTLAIPGVRQAAADLFGLPGIRIEFGDRAGDPPPTVTSIGGTLLLGEQVTLESIHEHWGHPLLVPGSLNDVTPEVYRNGFQGVPVISLLYPASDILPEIGSTGVGLLMMAIDDDGNSQYLMTKRVTGEISPVTVTVNGREGFWIEGGMLTVDASDPFWTYQRRSGNVLLWVQDGITYRMESSLSLEEALAVAESMQPVDPK